MGWKFTVGKKFRHIVYEKDIAKFLYKTIEQIVEIVEPTETAFMIRVKTEDGKIFGASVFDLYELKERKYEDGF